MYERDFPPDKRYGPPECRDLNCLANLCFLDNCNDFTEEKEPPETTCRVRGMVRIQGIPRSSLPEGPCIGADRFPTHFEIFRFNKDRLWHWRLWSATHDLVALAAQGYEQKSEWLASIALVKSTANDPIWDLSEIDPTQDPPFPTI